MPTAAYWSGPACPGPGPLESSHVTTTHCLSLSLSLDLRADGNAAGPGQTAGAPSPTRPLLDLLTLGPSSRLKGKAPKARWNYFFVCVHVYFFLDFFKQEFSLQRAARTWDVERVHACLLACVFRGCAPETAGIVPLFFQTSASLIKKVFPLFWGLLKHLG